MASCSPEAESEDETMTRAEPVTIEDRFAILALDCVHRQYPNKIGHVLGSDADAKTPQELYPAFYGCFDWHSSVHGHWLLEDEQLGQWRETLRPLEDAIVAHVLEWLPKLAYPVRSGTHNQTAFAFGLMLDYARGVGNSELETALVQKALEFHEEDVNCPLAYEPSGEDFLSPCLMEADLMRRVMDQRDFARWLSAFLPQIPTDESADWLEPGVVLDASDGKLVHLDGVNLSRAWALEGIASALPGDDARIEALLASARLHKEAGIAAVSDEHYSGSHWLASFATYLTTKRGIAGQ